MKVYVVDQGQFLELGGAVAVFATEKGAAEFCDRMNLEGEYVYQAYEFELQYEVVE